MTQTETHHYSSTEAVYEEIDQNHTIRIQTDYDYTRNEAYLTTVREGGVSAVREGGVAASDDGGNPTDVESV